MNRFAELLDRIAYEPGRNNKIRLVADYLRKTEDPDCRRRDRLAQTIEYNIEKELLSLSNKNMRGNNVRLHATQGDRRCNPSNNADSTNT